MSQQPTQPISETIFQILVGILFAIGLFDVVYSFTGSYARYGLLYPAAHVLLNIVLFLALSFIWSKERWAAWLFFSIVIIYLLLDLYVGAFSYLKLILLLPSVYFLVKIK
ncbi:MAG: hypothetical protein ACK5AO_05095 [bacterium]|jgi:hypothetical protein